MPPAARRHVAEPAGDASGIEEDGRDEHQGGAIIHGAAESGGQRLERSLGDPDDAQALLLEAVELAPDAVELAVGRDQAWPRSERQRREQTHDQLVGVGRQRDAASRVSQEPREPFADPLGLVEACSHLSST